MWTATPSRAAWATLWTGRWNNLVYLPCNAENGFVPSVPTEPVDVIYLCYPNNPTGTTLTKDQLKPFVDYARKHNAIIVYDAAYKAFITSDVPHSIYEVEGAREVAIECCSFSKTAGFTGTRCAYTIIPHEVAGLGGQGQKVELNALWKRRMGTKFNGVSYPIQRAAAAVFCPEGKAECAEAVTYYLRNARLIRDELQAAGYAVFGGVDAPYVWLKTPMDSWKFFDLLLDKAHVVGTPGTGFGPSGEGYFRLTAFNTYEKNGGSAGKNQETVMDCRGFPNASAMLRAPSCLGRGPFLFVRWLRLKTREAGHAIAGGRGLPAELLWQSALAQGEGGDTPAGVLGNRT